MIPNEKGILFILLIFFSNNNNKTNKKVQSQFANAIVIRFLFQLKNIKNKKNLIEGIDRSLMNALRFLHINVYYMLIL